MRHEISCGAVVFTTENNQIQYLLTQSLEGIYGFPKGHMENNETEIQTAVREIKEETGLDVNFIREFRYEENYLLPQKKDTMKHVIYFLAYYHNQSYQPQIEEVKEIRLVTYEQAMSLLTFESKKELLQKAHRFLSENKIILQD